MAVVNVTINGVKIEADSEQTILQVVRERNLDDIPTLCYEERLGHITSCFLCVVEVQGARGGMVPACSTKVTEGMVITTNSDKVKESRRTCLELFFSDHFADCISPCAQECPAGIDIQGYLTLVKKGLYAEAIQMIKEKNPLPIVCGRVCVRKCEVACRRNLLDEPVAIDFLKRYAAESLEGKAFMPKKKTAKDKKVAIIGTGPAGLSAAYYLAVEGYKVTIFESMPAGGGMLRYGIPAYRLPKDLLDSEIDSIRQLGVEIKYNQRLGRDFTLDQLRDQHEAVLLAVGSWGATGMGVENEKSIGVLSGLDVLRQTVQGELSELKGRVLVIGGGNTAIDVSRTALRLNAAESVIVYRRTEEQLPAHHEEIDAAKKEGVNFKFLVAPTKVVTDETGKVTGLECIRMELGAPDKSGRPRPVPMENSNYVEPADYIVAAIGQFSDLGCLESGECKVELDRWKNIAVGKGTMETNLSGVFSAGDVVTGPATVIEGVAAGRRAALAIHNKLSGSSVKVDVQEFIARKDAFKNLSKEDVSCFTCAARKTMPEREPAERIRDFNEVELGLSRQDTVEEAERCFQCGCLEVDDCLLRKYGEEYGVRPTAYLGDVNMHDVDRRHPFVQIDPNKCIKCGRCIKTCDGILENSALGFVNRGFSTIIAPAMRKPLMETNCISCGNCIDSCPTGALSENQPLFARISHEVKDHPAICAFCSTGCRLNVRSFGRDMRIRSRRDSFTGYGDYLCIRGRFGSSYLYSSDRLVQPFVNKEGSTHPYEWDQALRHVAGKLREVKDRYGSDSVAVFVSPKLTNEEIYTAVKLARTTIGTNLVGSYRDMLYGRNHHELDPVIGHTVSTTPMDDVQLSDVIVLVNTNPMETHPSFGWRIRDAWRKGAKIIVINSSNIDPVRHADVWLQPRRGTVTHILNAIMNEIVAHQGSDTQFIESRTTGFDEFKDFLRDYPVEKISEIAGVLEEKIRKAARMISEHHQKVTVIYDVDNPIDRSRSDLEALAQMLMMTGNFGENGRGLILLERHANSTGLRDMGAEPGYLPGRRLLQDSAARAHIESLWNMTLKERSPLDSDELRELFVAGKIKAALILGEDPLENPGDARYFRQMEFIAVLDMFPTETTKFADVVLPASTNIESGGSFTAFDRKVQFFPASFKPRSGKTNLQVLHDLAELMDKPLGFSNPQEAYAEILKANRLYANLTRKGDSSLEYWQTESNATGVNLYKTGFATPDGKGRFTIYRMDTMPFSGDELSLNSIEKYYLEKVRKLFLKGRLIPVL